MADEDLVRKVRVLGDIDLAALLCFTSREHCIISTDTEYLDDLTVELQLVASRTFGLNSTVVDCTPETTIDDLIAAIHLPHPNPASTSRARSPPHARGPDSYFGAHTSAGGGGTPSRQHQHGTLRSLSSLSPGTNATPTSPSGTSVQSTTTTQQQQIANVVLARNLDIAPKAVQIQCLELMRTRRIFTRTAVQSCPKQFLLVAVLGSESAGQARLTKHLNEHFYISHWQDPEDGFPHLDEEGYDEEGGNHIAAADDDNNDDDDADGIDGNKGRHDEDATSQASSASVVRRARSSKTSLTPISTPTRVLGQGQHISTTDWAMQSQGNSQVTDNNGSMGRSKLLTETDISTLSTLSLQTHVDIEVQRYLMNIIAFLRLHRAVKPGSIPPAATTHFRTLVLSLAALHGLNFATPELVQLAARKIYAHRLAIITPERERSMQWGSDLAAVKALLEDMQPEDVIEDVLDTVDVPI